MLWDPSKFGISWDTYQRRNYVRFPGGNSDRATPVPIPNTEVKPVNVDGTAPEKVWESRKLPGYK